MSEHEAQARFHDCVPRGTAKLRHVGFGAPAA
jgi:hypothetical protein